MLPRLKRDVFTVFLRGSLLGRRASLLGGWVAALILVASATGAAGASSRSTHKLDVVSDYFEFAAFLTRGFIIPTVHLKTAFDEERFPFTGILVSG